MALRLDKLAQVSRRLRNPQHSFNIRAKPFVIQPFCIAPVLPGETLKNGVMQSRVVTAPIKNPLIGWWKEYYFFYVKHRDLGQDALLNMMLDPSTSLAGLADASASAPWYHPGSGINWVKLCTEKCVEHYFRDEGEAWNAYTVDSMPIAQVNHNNVFDSMVTTAEYAAQDFDVDTADANTTVQASEVARALNLWELLRANNMTDMSYEDYLRSFGVRVQAEERNIPELLRYVREWTYPTNTVEPTTGVPSSAVSWAISERMDKDRYFKEPGFILGLTVTRPKVYLSAQTGAAVHLMQDAYTWLPAILRDDPQTSLKQLASMTGTIYPTGPAGVWLDVRDLFIYGDQFVNFALTATDAGLVALPHTDAQRIRYVSSADIDGLFAGADKLVKEDGIVRFSILGTQADQTPRGNALGFRL